MVKPQKEIFIAIDGVCPKAKMIQQRSRRHKSILENKNQRICVKDNIIQRIKFNN